jgi:indole-3-glycerol phosphate synthase
MILDKIVAATKIRIDQAKTRKPFDMVKSQAYKESHLPITKGVVIKERTFEKALSKPGINFICEIKKRLLQKA